MAGIRTAILGTTLLGLGGFGGYNLKGNSDIKTDYGAIVRQVEGEAQIQYDGRTLTLKETLVGKMKYDKLASIVLAADELPARKSIDEKVDASTVARH